MNGKEDEKFIRLAFEQARKAVEAGNEPFGAVLVKDGEVVAFGQNKINTESDPTYHAETGLIRDYCHEAKVTDLSDYTLYTSCEPCVMCASCMVWSKLGRMVYSITGHQLLEIVGESPSAAFSQEDDRGIDMPCAEVFKYSRNPIEVITGILEDEGLELYRSYLTGKDG
ncbi:MAG: nucleoside deaminase [Candidatus Euphemobacter frigidus]|jgi:tRNA(Arg) A34 adenosine deaminase TadA|nr:nucleoside deaminase [Candidatus Euphemobacter frigidus]